jgi:tetratricopeptide (TPR) repeat protein
LLGRISELADRAIALDDANPGAHLLVGLVALFRDRDFAQAIAEAKYAVGLDPNLPSANFQLAESFNHAGDGAQAIVWAEKAIRLDPLNRSWYSVETGTGYTITGQYTEAVGALKEHLAHYPNNLGAHAMLAVAYSELGQEQQARAEVAQIRRISPQLSLDTVKQRAAIWDRAFADRFYKDLSEAGLKYSNFTGK